MTSPRHSRSAAGLVFGVVFMACMVSATIGLIAASGSLLLVAAVAGGMVIAVLLSLRIEWVLWLLLLSAVLVTGSVGYFGGMGQIQWLTIAIGLALHLILILSMVAGRRGQPPLQIPAPLVFAIALVGLGLLTTLWSDAALGQWLYAVRYYLAISSLALVLAFLPIPSDLVRRLWMALQWVVLLQLPVCLYQYLFVARARAAAGAPGQSWDAVVGTMGGSQEAGGQSAAMGFFVIAGLLVAMALWKRGLFGGWRASLVALVALASIFLAEVKFMAILLPLAVLFLFRAQVLSHIKQTLVGLGVALILVIGMPTFYSKLHYEQVGVSLSTVEFYERLAEGAQQEHFDRDSGRMNRVAQVMFWWRQNDLLSRPKEFLIGHGLASTEISRTTMGSVARAYLPSVVAESGGVRMLWDVGVVGLLLVVATIASLAVMSLRLSGRREIEPFHRGALEAGSVILLMALVTLFYKDFLIKSPAVQVLVFLSAGQAMYWWARVGRETRQPRRSGRLRTNVGAAGVAAAGGSATLAR